MYNLLVVDDEEIAIRGIVEGIDWSSLPISTIYTAYDAEEARQIYRKYPVHVMLSDIDMPNGNGIELLAWVNEHSPDTVTIFFTGHADFKFAQQAIQLDSFNYLLKPIDHKLLKDCVGKAFENIAEHEQKEAFRKTYELYYEQWNRQLPLLVERLWQDILNLRIAATAGQLEPMFALYSIELDMNKPILPVLISVEEWKQEWNARDEEIMTYALKNAASDIILKGRSGHVIQDQNGMIFALLYDVGDTDYDLEERCREYVQKCDEYLYGIVSCYIGEPIQVANLRSCVQNLAEMEMLNIGQSGSVFRLSGFKKPKAQSAAPPTFLDWSLLLEHGKRSELSQRIEETFERFQREQVNHAFMVNYYYSFVNTVFQLLQKKSLSPQEVYPQTEWKDGEHAMKTLGAMKTWTLQFVGKAADKLSSQGKDVSNTIAKVQLFIETNLHMDLDRESIAEHVYLNPAYLSRLFRKETGKSLTDFTVELRLAKAKKELEKTNTKISDIAVSIGYSNFSHFSKLFKKITGLTPQEYRKKYQNVM